MKPELGIAYQIYFYNCSIKATSIMIADAASQGSVRSIRHLESHAVLRERAFSPILPSKTHRISAYDVVSPITDEESGTICRLLRVTCHIARD